MLCVSNKMVILDAFWENNSVVFRCQPRRGQEKRCPYCGYKSHVYDYFRKPRRWRSLDLGGVRVFLEYSTVRIRCPHHGVVVASVPWAAHDSRFTYAFEEHLAWLSVNCNQSVVASMMRVNWKSVGAVVQRVYERKIKEQTHPFDNLIRIGIDETSYKKGHKYMTVVINHDTNAVIWCAKGHGKTVLEGFFQLLTSEQRDSIQIVTADGARWIADTVAAYCKNAERVMDPFHVVAWMNDVLDELRKEAWRDARKQEREREAGQPKRKRGRPKKGEEVQPKKSSAIKGGRYALLKNPEHLTDTQSIQLSQIAREDKRVYRGYLLKERLRDVFKTTDVESARELLTSWLASACHSWVPKIRELSKKIRRHKDAILRAIENGISNARVEAINNKIKLTVRMAYGFRNIDNLISFVMLRCSHLKLALPGRLA